MDDLSAHGRGLEVDLNTVAAVSIRVSMLRRALPNGFGRPEIIEKQTLDARPHCGKGIADAAARRRSSSRPFIGMPFAH